MAATVLLLMHQSVMTISLFRRQVHCDKLRTPRGVRRERTEAASHPRIGFDSADISVMSLNKNNAEPDFRCVCYTATQAYNDVKFR